MWLETPHASALLALNATWFVASVSWLSWVDWRTQLLPNRLVTIGFIGQVLLMGPLSLVFIPLNGLNRLVSACVGCLAMFCGYLIIYLISRGQFGFGDVKFSAQLGLVVGWVGWSAWVWAFFLPFLLAGLLTVALLALRAISLKDHLPFGPFMSLGAVISIVWSLTSNT